MLGVYLSSLLILEVMLWIGLAYNTGMGANILTALQTALLTLCIVGVLSLGVVASLCIAHKS